MAAVVICVPSASLFAQSPALRIENTSIDLGEIRAGVPAGCRFAFVNGGNNAVEVLEARAGCGCLQPRLNQLQFAAGARGEIALDLKTLGQAAGPHTWQLTIVYRDGDNVHEQALQVTATVVIEVSVQPASVTLFTEGVVEHSITLTDLRDQPLKILALETTSPHLRAVAAPLAKNAAGHFTSKIAVHTGSDLPAGRHEEMLIIHTNDAGYPEFKIPVTIVKQAASRIMATPSEVILNGLRMVRLRDQQDQAVVIESVSADVPAVVCSWASGPDNQATLRIQLDATKVRAGETSATVRVQVSSPVREMITIGVRWESD